MTDTDEKLAYGGVCPVCGDEFTDGFDGLETGESYENVRLCIIDKGAEDGGALFHFLGSEPGGVGE